MGDWSPKERLIRILNREPVDRPPVICPGGMMNAAIVDVMNRTGHTLPAAHHDGRLMAELASDVHELTGFENLGLPFCMTVEPEVLGSAINFGSLACEPKIAKENFPSVRDVEFNNFNTVGQSGRIGVVSEAAYRLAQEHPDYPVIGSLTGPISTAASIVDPIPFLKDLRKDKKNANRVVDYVSDFLIRFAEVLIDSGVDVISIADPTATGEILGPKIFEEYAVHYLNKIITAVHQRQVPVILHICGDLKAVKQLLPQLQANAVSADALVNLRQIKEEFPQITTMGNVSTYLLELGTVDKVIGATEKLLQDGIDIIAPACGLSTATSLQNISAMTDRVKEHSDA